MRYGPDNLQQRRDSAANATAGFGARIRGMGQAAFAEVEVAMQSQSSRYLRGTRPGEQPVTIHAAVLHGQDDYTALCDNRAVEPLAGTFDPDDPAACPQCRPLAA
ncbi:MAG TPA: hypothetical protein VH520_08520 [Streptosporangiaceae bacterium]